MSDVVGGVPSLAGSPYARLRARRRVLVSDIDGTLLEGARAGRGCAALAERLELARAALVLATGRDLMLTLEAVDELMAAGLPRPEALICSVGSELYLGEGNRPDEGWARHIAEGWDGPAVRRALAGVRGLEPQPAAAQRPFKASYFLTPEAAGGGPGGGAAEGRGGEAAAASALSAAGLQARLIASAGRFLDVLPPRASKGAAVGWLIAMAAFDPRGVVVAGDSGNDREMLLAEPQGQALKAVVVGNHEPELAALAGRPSVYLAAAHAAAGVLEGLIAHGW